MRTLVPEPWMISWIFKSLILTPRILDNQPGVISSTATGRGSADSRLRCLVAAIPPKEWSETDMLGWRMAAVECDRLTLGQEKQFYGFPPRILPGHNTGEEASKGGCDNCEGVFRKVDGTVGKRKKVWRLTHLITSLIFIRTGTARKPSFDDSTLQRLATLRIDRMPPYRTNSDQR